MSSKDFAGFLILLALMVLFVTGTADAATYYVDKTHAQASDSNPGTEALPWKTVRHASDVLVAGDTVYVKGDGATYVESWSGRSWSVPVLTPQNSGSPGKPITFRAYAGHKVTLAGAEAKYPVIGTASGRNYIIWEGFHVLYDYDGSSGGGGAAAMTSTVGSEIGYCTIRNIAGIGKNVVAGIIVHEAQDSRVHHCDISGFEGDSANQGAMVIWQWENASNLVVEDNYFHDNATGIYDKAGGIHTTMRRNLIRGNSFGGIEGYSPEGLAGTFFIYDNVLDNDAIDLYLRNTGSEVHDNLFVNTSVSATSSDVLQPKIWNNVVSHAAPRAWRQNHTYTSGDLGYFDYNVYTGMPSYRFVSTDQKIAWMQGIGYESHSQQNVLLNNIYDASWNLKAPYKTSGRHGDAVGPGNGSDGLVAQIMNLNRYGPGALGGGGNTTAPGAPKNLRITP